MITSRELVLRTLDHSRPERVPRHLWLLPWAEIHHPDAVSRLRREYPDDIATAPVVHTDPPLVIGDRYARGTHVDEWGCRFENPHDGAIGIVQIPLIADWNRLDDFHPPEATLSVDREAVDAYCRSSDRFVLSPTLARPFERLQFIRTMEQALIDLMERPAGLGELLGRIHRHYLKEIDVWSGTAVDGIAIMDDWGTQTALLASPEIFREIFKPMYREYAEIARAAANGFSCIRTVGSPISSAI